MQNRLEIPSGDLVGDLMEDKLENPLLKTDFSMLKDNLIDPYLNGHNLRSFSCTCRFFSSSLKESMKKKPIWQIIAGLEQTFFLNSQTGELYGIGKNEYYSLGISTYPAKPVNKILLSEQIVPFELFVGAFQSFILSKEGTLYGTGRNSSRELAKVRLQYVVPFREVFLQEVRSVAVMYTTTLFLSQDNEIYSTKHGNLKIPNKTVKQIEAAYFSALILCTDMTFYRYRDSCIKSHLEEIAIPNLEIKKIKAKGLLSLILTKDNKLYLANQNEGNEFIHFLLPEGLDIKNVHLGAHHIIIQSTNNKLFGYGDNNEGQLGLGKGKPKISSFEEISLPTEAKICYVVTGFHYTFVICENDEIYGFGNAHDQLGEEKGSCHFSPKRLYLIDEVKELARLAKAEEASGQEISRFINC